MGDKSRLLTPRCCRWQSGKETPQILQRETCLILLLGLALLIPALPSASEIRNQEENRPHPKKIPAVFQFMNLGDGTGFAGSEGLLLLRKISRLTSVGPSNYVAFSIDS